MNSDEMLRMVALVPPTIAIVMNYWQLRRNNHLNFKVDQKASVDNAIKYIDRFCQGVLAHYQEYKACIAHGIYKGHMIPVEGYHNFDIGEEVHDREKKEMTNVYKYMNELDIIATAIQLGQVDKSVCKQLIGSVFCEAVEVYFDLISSQRVISKDYFQMTVKLYLEWRISYSSVTSPINVYQEKSIQATV